MAVGRRSLLIGLALLGGVGVRPAAAQEQRPLLVFAAASLQPALTAIAAAWQRDTGRRVTISYAASSALARQLDSGAPADLFASADREWMDWAEQRGLIRPATRRNLLGNRLVLITGHDTVTDLTIAPGFALAAAIGDSRLATGHTESVPVGKYARAALTSLGVWPEVAPRLAGVDTPRAALMLVARGEARFGIVYQTDARSEPHVRVVGTFPETSHPPIVYPFAVTASSRHPDAAAFLAHLSSPAAVAVFEAEGFRILARPEP